MIKSKIVELGTVFFASVIVLSLGFIIWEIDQRKEPHALHKSERLSPYPIKIEKLLHAVYKNNRLTAKIEADEFKVNPRKFWIFNVKSLNEATFYNVRLEIYLDNKTYSNAELFSFGKDLLSLSKESLSKKNKYELNRRGQITRGVIKKGLILKIYKIDTLAFMVKAKEAYIDFNTQETRLVGASIEDLLSKKLIKSSSVIWDNKEKVFKVSGKYIAKTPKGVASGEGIKVNLDFVVNLL